ncbi:MAG: chemotaxis protein [Humidesulfovibrio sp.]|uniref:chemotaxis protein n=1 Tax=Humidesulfovibrio sp. TaxID=2910988 RepID=UPI0027F8BB07|nr:chemotaxis protein [Humidesulfovibrio sp.]MDQ7834902.1 chemotaxis protein [Humidesulfovibrio sp.]
MNQTSILLESGTNELEIIELYLLEPGPDGKPEPHYFGVNVAKVLEIIEASDKLEPSASSPHPSFLGVIPLRDMVLPVVDLSIWLGVSRVPTAHETVIVTEFNGVRSGFLVSGVTMIHRVGWAEVEPPSRMLADLPGNCITGTVRLGEHFALLLDLERALVELGAVTIDLPDHVEQKDEERPLRVLLVDDSTSVRFLLKRNFESAGFEVEAKGNGEDAWNFLVDLKAEAASRKTPITGLLDAVISDVEMPRMDGYTLTRNIKADSELSRLPVVLFSSLISPALLHKGQSVGADAQITKPEFGGLTTQVREIIEKRRAG